MKLRRLRTRAVWLIVLPFFVFARPTVPLLLVGAALSVFGLWIRGWSAGTIHKNQALTVTGPYAYTRNPLYVGSFLIGLGVSVAGGHWVWPLVFLVFYASVYRDTIAHEASRLTELFGDAYREYAANVPGFVPRATPWRRGAVEHGGEFRWSQYRWNREWEALLGALAAFGILTARALLGA